MKAYFTLLLMGLAHGIHAQENTDSLEVIRQEKHKRQFASYYDENCSYAKILKVAYKKFEEKNYATAMILYMRAHLIKPNDTYVLKQIYTCQLRLLTEKTKQ